MHKCVYGNFNGMLNPDNNNVWFFGRCFDSIIEVVKMTQDVPMEYDDYIDINGLVCFVRTQTGQVWYQSRIFDDVSKACHHIKKILKSKSGTTSVKNIKHPPPDDDDLGFLFNQ